MRLYFLNKVLRTEKLQVAALEGHGRLFDNDERDRCPSVIQPTFATDKVRQWQVAVRFLFYQSIPYTSRALTV